MYTINLIMILFARFITVAIGCMYSISSGRPHIMPDILAGIKFGGCMDPKSSL